MRYRSSTLALAILLGACSGPDAPVGVPSAHQSPRGAHLPGHAFTRQDLGTLGGTQSYAADIGEWGTVVGWSETAGGETHAFRWTPAAGMSDLGTLPGHTTSQAVAVVGGWLPGTAWVLGVSGGPGPWTPVAWSPSGAITALPIAPLGGATFSFPTDANMSGVVVGWDDVVSQHAFAWSPSRGKVDLTATAPVAGFDGIAFAVNEVGQVGVTTQAFGACGTFPSCYRTYIWSQAAGWSALGTPGPDAGVAVLGSGLSERGIVVGAVQGFGPSEAFRWSRGAGFRILPSGVDPASFGGATAAALNERGTIVGRVFDWSRGGATAVLWPATGGGVVLLSPDDPNTAVPVAINELGTVAGWATVADGVNHAVTWRAAASTTLAVRGAREVAPAAVRRYAAGPADACLASAETGATRQRLLACVARATLAARGR